MSRETNSRPSFLGQKRFHLEKWNLKSVGPTLSPILPTCVRQVCSCQLHPCQLPTAFAFHVILFLLGGTRGQKERCAKPGFSILTQRFANTPVMGESLGCRCLWGRGEFDLASGGGAETQGELALAWEPQGLVGGAEHSAGHVLTGSP